MCARDETRYVRYGKNGRDTDRTQIIYNSGVTICGIPPAAHDYVLGPRSAIDWLVDRYQVKTHKDSQIVNDPNDWADEHHDPRYIFDLIGRVVTVSMRTVEIVGGLPSVEIGEASR